MFFFLNDKLQEHLVFFLLTKKSIKNGRTYPMKAIKGHINGRVVPTNTSRLHNLSRNIDKLSGNIDKLSGFIT